MSVDYRPEYDPADVDSDYGHTGGDITVPTFTATMKPFRFWCQKALPLVYDDSLSYYEVLCKVVKQMNDFLTDLQTATGAIDEFAQQFVINQQFLNDMADQLGQNVQDLEDYINDRFEDYMTAYTQLQNYVNNYFDNLDVQQEINNKLDEMASDGTLNDLFDPVLETWMQQKTAQIDAAIAGQNAVQAQQNGRISVLEGRMDTFEGLPAGSTAGNAELIGIRTNFLGEVYPTAGDAVRSSDMIASGFDSIPFTRLEEWNGNEAATVYDTLQIDVSAYKGGRVIMIANMEGFESAVVGIGVGVYATNVSGKTADQDAHAYILGSNVFVNYSVIPTDISGEERIALYFNIPDNFSYQYLKMGFVEPIPIQDYTQPAAIVYATSWSKTKVDPTLTQEGEAADAKATGDALVELNERLDAEIDNVQDELLIIESAFDTTETDITPTTETNDKYINTSGEEAESPSMRYVELEIDSALVGKTLLISGSAWYTVNPYVFVGSSVVYPNTPSVSSPAQYTDMEFTPTETGTLYVNRYVSGNNIQIASIKSSTLTNQIKETSIPVDEVTNNVLQGMTDALSYTPVDTGEMITSKLLNGATGAITDGTNAIQRVTDYITVVPNNYYLITTEANYGRGLYAWYDSEKNFISGESAASGSSYTNLFGKKIKSPENATYIVIGLIYQNQYPFVSLMKGNTNESIPSKRWSGLKWSIIGDSLSESYTPTGIHYFELISAATGISWTNLAKSGNGYARGTSNFRQQALNVPADSDVVTFFGSGNDASSGLPLGTATDTGTTTVAGCINTAIDNLYTIIPAPALGIITPTPWKNNMPYNNGWMESYANLLVAICKRRSIPCLDLYHCSNLDTNSTDVQAIAYSRDNGNATHLNEFGHKMIAPRIQAFMETLLMH